MPLTSEIWSWMFGCYGIALSWYNTLTHVLHFPSYAEIKCELTLPPLQGTTYEPAYRSRFSPGEKVTVTCEERYWIGRTRTRSVETTCNEDGQWSVRPVCQGIKLQKL